MSEFIVDNGKLKKYVGASKSVIVPDCVKQIGRAAFYHCATVEHITVSSGVTKIEAGVFPKRISKVYIPASVTEIADNIFECNIYQEYDNLVVGGEKGSLIESFCNAREIDFVEVEADGLEDFFNTSNKELRCRLDEEIAKESKFFVDESEHGYCAELIGDTLRILVPDHIVMDKILITDMQDKLTKRRLSKIKHMIIGDRVTAIKSVRNLENLQSVWIGADVEEICPGCFENDYNLATIKVDERNKFYRSLENSILFSCDLKTLVRYAPARPDDFYAIPTFVETIAPSAFQEAYNLICVKVGENVRNVGDEAFYNAVGIKHIYFESGDTALGDYVFSIDGDYCLYKCMAYLVVGGKQGSAVERWCKEQKIRFQFVADDQVDTFLEFPPDQPFGEDMHEDENIPSRIDDDDQVDAFKELPPDDSFEGNKWGGDDLPF